MRLRRNSDDSQIAGVPGAPAGIARPGAAAGHPKGSLAAPDRNAIRSVGVAILPGLPLPDWATPAMAGPWTPAQESMPYADPRSVAPMPTSPQVPGADPALAALAPASSPLPPPDPAQWSERPAGPVVWGPVPPPRQPSPPQQVPVFPTPQQQAPAYPTPQQQAPVYPTPQQQAPAAQPPAPANPWFTPESMPPPATSSAGQYGWLVQPDVPASGSSGAMTPPAGPALAPTSGPFMTPPSGPAVAPPPGFAMPPSTPPPAPGQSPDAPTESSFIGIPQQATPLENGPAFAQPVEEERPLPMSGPTSTTAPIAWVRSDVPVASQPSATVPAPTDAPSSPLTPAEPVLEPAGVATRPADAPAGDTQPAPAPTAMAAGAAWVLADPVQPAARMPAPAPQPMAVPPSQPMAMPSQSIPMPVPTGRPVPLPPPDMSARFVGLATPGAGSPGGPAGTPQGPGFATPPPGAWAPPVGQSPQPVPDYTNAPTATASAPDEQPGRSGRTAKILLAILSGLLVLAVAAVLLFVTPGFLRSQPAPAAPPVVQTPTTVAGLSKSEPAPGGTAVMSRIAEAAGATATSQIATYTGNGAIATVWVANAAGGSPAVTATEFENAGGAPLEPLRSVPPGPRGGEMACAAATPARTLCFWTGDGVRGAADIRGMGRAEAAQLAAQMRVDLEQPAQ